MSARDTQHTARCIAIRDAKPYKQGIGHGFTLAEVDAIVACPDIAHGCFRLAAPGMRVYLREKAAREAAS